MDVKILRGQLAATLSDARKLTDQYKGKEGEMSPEIATQINGLLGKADSLKAQIDMANRLGGLEAETGQGEVKAANAAWREAGPGEGNVPFDEKAWREVEVKNAFGQKSTIRYHVPIAVEAKGYAPAFEAYLRKGVEGVGGSDRKTLSAGVDTAGGFLIPQDYHAELIKKRATMAMMRSLSRVATTSRDKATWPRVNYTTDNKYTSGVRMSWVGETPSSSTVHRVTDPVFGSIDIPVYTAMASIPLTNMLLEDAAFDLVAYSSDLFGEAFGLGENDTFLNGNGIAKPTGLLTQVVSGGATGPDYTVSGTSNSISTSGDAHAGKRLIDLFYAVPAQYRNAASWLMNSTTLAAVDNLVDAQKRPLIQSLTNASLGMGTPDTIKNRPLYVDEFVPDIAADSYPIIFGDFSGYLILDRVAFSVQRNDMLYMETDITLLIGRQRVGGYCIEPYKLRVLKAGTA